MTTMTTNRSPQFDAAGYVSVSPFGKLDQIHPEFQQASHGWQLRVRGSIGWRTAEGMACGSEFDHSTACSQVDTGFAPILGGDSEFFGTGSPAMCNE